MKRIATIALLFVAFAASAQEKTGIKFVHNLSWAQIKAKAKAEHKYIFVDGFTTWCGPCKRMEKDIYPLAAVGEEYNKDFINVKAQLDTSKADNDEVKQWYKDAHNIAADYKVRAYPTYLYFNPDGELVHRAVGSCPAPEFIKRAQDAQNPDVQYYTMIKGYNAGKRDSAFLHRLSLAAEASYDMDFGPVVINNYLKTQPDLYTPENIRLLTTSTTKVTDPGFEIFYKNGAKADALLGPGASAYMVKSIITKDVLKPMIYADGKKVWKTGIDWANVRSSIAQQYPALADELIYPAEINYYKHLNNWPKFSETVSEYVKINTKVGSNELNDFAWSVFQNCDDAACVDKALAWSKQSLDGDGAKNAALLDTYANLLYKTGKKDDAIKAEQTAIAAAGGKDDGMEATLEKMKKGEPTW